MKLIFFTTALSTLFSGLLLAQSSIHITNGEWEPYLSQYSYQYGFDSHVVSEACKLAGIDITWGFFPWKRAYQNAKKGLIWQASCCWWPSPKTKKAFYISDVISETSFVFFHLKSYPFDWQSFSDLKHTKVGTTFEYDYGQAFIEALAKDLFQVEYVARDEQNYQKLLAGTIQIFPNDPLVGYSQIRNSVAAEQAKRFTHHPKEFEKSTLHLIISKKDERGALLMKKFNAALKQLKDSGRYEQMRKGILAGVYDKQKTKWQQNAFTEK